MLEAWVVVIFVTVTGSVLSAYREEARIFRDMGRKPFDVNTLPHTFDRVPTRAKVANRVRR